VCVCLSVCLVVVFVLENRGHWRARFLVVADERRKKTVTVSEERHDTRHKKNKGKIK